MPADPAERRGPGLCHWHCAFAAAPGGERIDLDGIFRCRFSDETRVEAFEEWWHVNVEPQR